MEITASELQQQPSISPSENDTTIFFIQPSLPPV